MFIYWYVTRKCLILNYTEKHFLCYLAWSTISCIEGFICWFRKLSIFYSCTLIGVYSVVHYHIDGCLQIYNLSITLPTFRVRVCKMSTKGVNFAMDEGPKFFLRYLFCISFYRDIILWLYKQIKDQTQLYKFLAKWQEILIKKRVANVVFICCLTTVER